MSLFRGSFTNHAAAAVFEEAYDKAEDSLGILLDHSLIEFDSKSSRYTQNELVLFDFNSLTILMIIHLDLLAMLYVISMCLCHQWILVGMTIMN